jgi:hypothetical protein
MEDFIYQDEMESKIDVFERGRVLKTCPQDVWEVIKDTIHSYVEDANEQVRNIQPGDPSVTAAQASLYALSKFERFFLEDTKAAMEFSTNPSEEFLKYLYTVRDSLDVIKHQGLGE